MSTIAPPPAPPAVAKLARPSLLRRLAARCSGTIVSVVIHGSLAVLAFLSVTSPRMGRGGGVEGTSEIGSAGSPAYSALVHQDDLLNFDSHQPDARAFPDSPAEEIADAPEAVPLPPQDFLKEPADAGLPIPKPAPTTEEAAHGRSKGAYAKLPPSTGATESESKLGSDQKGNSTVNGTGGDTGGAGDGTVGALFMPSPDYPSSARRRGIEGIVVVIVEVQSDGHCENARVSESSGNDALDDAALTAIRKWRYEPRPNEPVEPRRVRFVFKLTR